MEFVNGKDDIPYMMEKMFETTNQYLLMVWYTIYDQLPVVKGVSNNLYYLY